MTVVPVFDLTGKRFGRLNVLCIEHKRHDHRYWWCRCDCGEITLVRGSLLRYGKTQSCGCIAIEKAKQSTHRIKHNQAGSHVYQAWAAMKQRCHNPNDPGFHNYGGRGITVCERWRNDFAAFAADMGPRPKGMSLDRIDNDGNYEPSNCRWADWRTQCMNKKRYHRTAGMLEGLI